MSLDGVATEGVKALCFCLSRQINHQKQLKQNMDTLERRMRALIAKNDDNMSRVECAESEGGTVSNEVTNWLLEVESMKRAVSDTQRNFAEQTKCWKGVFPNYYRRRKISKMSSRLIDQVNDLITNGKFENGVTIELPTMPIVGNALPTMPIVGKTADLTRQEILGCILGRKKRIIGVHGMGGVGKTTIMRNIHNDLSQQSESKHFDCFIWITVSNDVDVNKLQRKIAKELKIDMEEDDDENDRARKIFNALKRRKKFLLILDDMWDAFNLDEVGIPIPSEENGCKVVLTTRNKGISGQMQAHPIEVRVLSEEESWEFFKDIVVVGGVILSKDIENLAKDVFHCKKLKYLLPARLLQQLRCLKSIKVSGCRQMKEIVGEEEEMGITREDDNNAMLILSQLQKLEIIDLRELKGICSRVLICKALETVHIQYCPKLKKLPFSVDNLPCALKEIKGEKEWWDAVEWDHPQTRAHFDSTPKMFGERMDLFDEYFYM